MAQLEVIALDTAVPQLRAPAAGDTYSVPRDMTLASGTTLTAPTVDATTGNITTVNATTIDATNVEVTNVKAKDGTAAITIADSTGAVTVDAGATINGGAVFNETGADVDFRIESDTDANAFVLDGATGNVGIGTSSPGVKLDVDGALRTTGTIASSGLYIRASDGSAAQPSLQPGVDADTGFYRPASNTIGFSTAGTEKMRIDSSGNVGIGGAAGAETKFEISGTYPSSGTLTYVSLLDGTIPSGSTGAAVGYYSALNTEAASFTLGSLRHFQAAQGAIGAGSTVTNQFGYRAESSLTGATNNYGFYSNIASGSGRYNFFANGSADNYFGGPTTISVNSSSDALRITQVGAGNALLVEDSANPDASPFVIDPDGRALIGLSSSYAVGSATGLLQVTGTTNAHQSISRFTANSASPSFNFGKSRGTSPTSLGIVSSGDGLGTFNFSGDDGAAFISAASISAAVDGTPGTNDMPGRLTFSTTADGAATPTEKMRIDNAGNVVVNTAAIATTATDGFLYVPSCAGTPTGTPTTYTGRVPIVVDTTNHKLYFYSGGTWRDAGP